MKPLLLAALLTTTATADNLCTKIGELAKTVQGNRQAGVPAAKMIEIAENYGEQAKILELIVIDAYKSPRFDTDRYQQKEITEFHNKWLLGCLEAGE